MKKILTLFASAWLMLGFVSCLPDEQQEEKTTNNNWQNQHCQPVVNPQ